MESFIFKWVCVNQDQNSLLQISSPLLIQRVFSLAIESFWGRYKICVVIMFRCLKLKLICWFAL